MGWQGSRVGIARWGTGTGNQRMTVRLLLMTREGRVETGSRPQKMACRVSRRRDRWGKWLTKSQDCRLGESVLDYPAPCWVLGLGSRIEDRGCVASRGRGERQDNAMRWDSASRVERRSS